MKTLGARFSVPFMVGQALVPTLALHVGAGSADALASHNAMRGAKSVLGPKPIPEGHVPISAGELRFRILAGDRKGNA
ncbi:MAG: hypothetical protein NVSMB62_22680 [Acidobacteriaceae bacterium]